MNFRIIRPTTTITTNTITIVIETTTKQRQQPLYYSKVALDERLLQRPPYENRPPSLSLTPIHVIADV